VGGRWQQVFERCLHMAVWQQHQERQHGVAQSLTNGPLKSMRFIAPVTTRLSD